MGIKIPSDSPYLIVTRLAEKLGRTRQYVYAMMAAGYQMEFGLTTTIEHAEAWLREHPGFRTCTYFKKRKARRRPAATVN